MNHMLPREDFAKALEIIIKCLPTVKSEDRIEGLYYFFKNEALDTITKACDEMARDLDKFPTPVIFGNYIAKHKRGETEDQKIPCDFCNGNGIVSATKIDATDNSQYTFRCYCQNASKLQKISPWTKTTREKYKLIETNIYQDIALNPDKYLKGIKFLKNNAGVKITKDIENKIRERVESAQRIRANLDKRFEKEDIPF